MLVMEPGAKLRAEAGMLVVERRSAESVRISPSHLRGVVAGSGVVVSSPALTLITESGCTFVQLGKAGRVSHWTIGHERSMASNILAQAMMESDRKVGGPRSLSVVVDVIAERIKAMDSLLAQHERTGRSDSEASVDSLREARKEIGYCVLRLASSSSIDEARGYEGAASAAYFGCMAVMLTGELRTQRRTRRPPRDEVNAMLSLGYSLLVAEMVGSVIAHGLTPELGLLHPPDFRGRPALALDLVEPLRISVVDRLVLSVCNRRQMNADHFTASPESDGGVLFSAEGRRKFYACYQEAMASGVVDHEGPPRSVRDLIDLSVRWYMERIHGE